MSSYTEKLNTRAWQKKRTEVLTKAGFTCQFYGDQTQRLDVHHPRYEKGREPWQYDNLIALCRNCHDLAHDIRPVVAPVSDPLARIIRFDAAHGNADAIALLSHVPSIEARIEAKSKQDVAA